MSAELGAKAQIAYGGVVIDASGRVLLREPRNHFDGYVWTFPKRRPEPGETPEQTALREVEEETGVRATVLAPIPGEYSGGTTRNRYFLMSPLEPIGPLPPDCPETVAVKWVSLDEAKGLLQMTHNLIGRKRDLAILEAGAGLVGGRRNSGPSL